MKNKTYGNIGCLISFSCYILSSQFIFSPLHKSANIILSAITAFFTGFFGLILILRLLERERSEKAKSTRFQAAISIICSAFSTVISLMLLTEIIKDTAYVANRGISLFYYISLSLAILTVSYYLCCNSEKGIYRFSILSALPFMLLFILIFTAFTTTKSIVFDIKTSSSHQVINSLSTGALTGAFLTSDTSVYILCFDRYIRNDDGYIKKKPMKYGFASAMIIIAVYNITTVLIFGTKLTSTISDPDYALLKLLPGIDLTEIISALRIISFMIKSSVYIFYSAKLLKHSFAKENTSIAPFIFIQYILIPITVIILTVFDRNLEYGAFQHLIYPTVIIFSFLTVIANFSQQRKH